MLISGRKPSEIGQKLELKPFNHAQFWKLFSNVMKIN
jgi:hypothetical protein